MKKIITLLVMLGLVVSLLPNAVLAADGKMGTVYVSTTGRDTAEGTIDAPLATFKAAQDKVRSMIASGEYPKGITVFVRGGTYNFSEPFVLDERDSGTETAPIVWRNYGEEEVLITGGMSIAASKFTKVTDENILNRIVTASARNSVYSVNLSQFGIKDTGEPYLVGSSSYSDEWYGDVVKKPKCPGMEVLFNGKAMTNARYPNSGYMTYNKIVKPSWNWDIPDEGSSYEPFSFTVSDERIKYWTEAPENSILMFGYWKWGWADQTIPLKSIDLKNKEITTAWASFYGAKDGQNFYVYNLLEELDSPGEYFIDRATNTLYINPPSDIKKADVKISFMDDNLITFNNVKNVTLKNLDITAVRGQAIVINGGENNLITGSEISYTAMRAVDILGGKNNGIRDCYIHDVDGGIKMNGGDIVTLTPAGNYAINNHIENFARITPAYTAAVAVGGVGNIVKHNEMHGGRHLAISFGGQNTQILYNDIYDVLQETDDAGAVYGGLNWTSRGLDIKYNYIHDINSKSIGSTMGIYGIYGDGGQCGMNIVGNILEDIPGSGILVNGGHDNKVINNYLIGNTKPGIDVTEIMKYEPNVSNMKKHHHADLERNIAIMDSPQWKEQFPEFFELMKLTDAEKGIPSRNYVVNNIAVDCDLVTGVSLVAANCIDNETVKPENAGFVDYSGGDFNMKEDSPLIAKMDGFKPIPFTRIGTYTDRALARVQDAILMSLGSYTSMVNGEIVNIDENPDVIPFAEDGRTYVPLRFLSESLGAAVDYTDGVITISTPTTSLVFTIDSLDAKKNGEAIKLEKPLVVRDNRTLIPLREVSELLGKQVYWNECGLIAISDNAELFDAEGGTDEDIIIFLNEKVKSY